MRSVLGILAMALILIGGFYAFNSYIYNEKQNDMTSDPTADASTVQVIPIAHATGIIVWGDTAIYMDPTGGAEAFSGQPPADIVLVTDIHGDHLDPETLKAVVRDAALIVSEAVRDALPPDLAANAIVMANGDVVEKDGFRIEATPMYNLPDAANSDRHPKGRGNGYLIEKDGFRVYIAGDTAGTPEVRAMQDIDIAFLPMNLPYTMGVEEAAETTLAFKPRSIYPYHYRSPDGLADVAHFKELVLASDPSIEVVLAKWY